MADMWNIGAVIMMVTFIGAFAILIGSMPMGFIVGSSPEVKGVTPYDYLTTQELEEWRYYVILNVTDGTGMITSKTFDFNFANSSGKYNVIFRLIWYNHATIIVQRLTALYFGIFADYSTLTFENESYTYGTSIDVNDLVAQFDSRLNVSKFYPVQDGAWHIAVFFRDYNSSRNDIYAAWSDAKLTVDMRFGLQNQSMTYSAWDIVGKLLFFQASAFNICDPIVNALIALPIWAAIVYIILRIVLLFIPFLGD